MSKVGQCGVNMHLMGDRGLILALLCGYVTLITSQPFQPQFPEDRYGSRGVRRLVRLSLGSLLAQKFSLYNKQAQKSNQEGRGQDFKLQIFPSQLLKYFKIQKSYF